MTDSNSVEEILKVQLPAYMVEAELIDFYGIPNLKDTAETIKSCGETFYGYYVDEALAGFIAYKLEDGLLDIYRLAIHPEHFRKGIATSLLSYMEEQNPGINKIIVSTGSKNYPARNVYLNNGFRIAGEKEVAPSVFITLFEKLKP